MSENHGIKAYSGATGIVDDTLHNPYDYFGKIRALGLAADGDTLDMFIQNYLNKRLEGSGIQFELAERSSPIVTMLIGDFFRITGAHNRGNFRNRNCQFHIPVICHDGDSQKRGSVQVFSYASNMWNVLTSTELRGPATRHSIMRFRTWLEDLDTNASPQNCYSMAPQIIGEDGEVTNTVIVSVQKRAEPLESDCEPAAWNLDDLRTIFAIKQFQHEEYQLKACYESLVQIDLSDTGLQTLVQWGKGGDSDERLAKACVRIRQDRFHPIVENLGLKTCLEDTYPAPETALETLKSERDAADQEKAEMVTDHLLSPVYYLVYEAGAPEDKDEHETVTKLQENKILYSKDTGADTTAPHIHESEGKTLCYRYRTDLPNNGWMRRDPPTGH